ncbi:hypothetical protein ACI2I3_10355 [Psychrobacter namhaensis]|uniref:Uncharacterized protein n=1 Tax=Psychrobacter namhaensis TaxID=292734 RepID=A0ABW8LA08_9GAMM
MSTTGLFAGLLYFVLLMASMILLKIWADGDTLLICFGGATWLVLIVYWSWFFKKKGFA